MHHQSDILIIGGGLMGLAIALELRLRGASVSVLSRNYQEAAGHAAAGMLAPHAEGLPPGPLLDLCLRSRWLYPEWVRKLQDLSGRDLGYQPQGILAPCWELPSTPALGGIWLDHNAIHLHQSGLSSEVIGGWWYPEDGQVDNRQIMLALQEIAEQLGVNLVRGVTVQNLQQKHQRVQSILTNQGEWEASTYILTTGSWAQQLIPLPVFPIKGQMAALTMPPQAPLERVLFGPATYLVPRQNSRLIIGATSEKVGWQLGNTPAGMTTLLQRAERLYPALADWPIEEFWWGFRPGTPDEMPLLGPYLCDNLILALGHYRNGVLLAPVTASLIANLVDKADPDPLLQHFRGDRFFSTPMTSVISSPTPISTDSLCIAGRTFNSRLLTGSGKYANLELMQKSILASGCEIVTVAVRRVQTQAPGHIGLAEAIDWSQIWMLPNTAGCQTAEEAIRVARLGREMAKLLGQEDNNFVKLEVIPDPKYLLPDPIDTLAAAEQLVKEGFAVLPYINADPLLAQRLEEVGCATVMPLGSPIGSGQGIRNAANIAIIIEQARVPVVVDAGIATPSEAAQAMEMGAAAVLINSAIALSPNPVAMAEAMNLATQAGRKAYLAGRMPQKAYANASSPLTGMVQ